MALSALDEDGSRWTVCLTINVLSMRREAGGILGGSSVGLTGGKRHGQRILSQRYSLHHRRESQHLASKPGTYAAKARQPLTD